MAATSERASCRFSLAATLLLMLLSTRHQIRVFAMHQTSGRTITACPSQAVTNVTRSMGSLLIDNIDLEDSRAMLLEFAGIRVRMCDSPGLRNTISENTMLFTDEMLYAAFRAAFVSTLDCMLREALDRKHAISKGGGFLDVYPILQGTAPQIQLECLLRTWDHLHHPEMQLSQLDQCVLNAAFEALAKMGELTTSASLSSVWKGPKPIVTACDHWVTSKMRVLQLAMDERASKEFVSATEELDVRGRTSGTFSRLTVTNVPEDLISIVGRWTASSAVVLGSQGLLNDDEQDILRLFFEEQTGLLA